MSGKVSFDEWVERPGTSFYKDGNSYLILDYQDGEHHICICWFPNHTYGWWIYGQKGHESDTLYGAGKAALKAIGKEPE